MKSKSILILVLTFSILFVSILPISLNTVYAEEKKTLSELIQMYEEFKEANPSQRFTEFDVSYGTGNISDFLSWSGNTPDDLVREMQLSSCGDRTNISIYYNKRDARKVPNWKEYAKRQRFFSYLSSRILG